MHHHWYITFKIWNFKSVLDSAQRVKISDEVFVMFLHRHHFFTENQYKK